MYKCLRCGWTSRARTSRLCTTPDCFEYTVGVDRYTSRLAVLLYKMGYRLSFTEAYPSWVPTAPDEDREVAPHGWALITACIEFARCYPEEVFPDIPLGWSYYTDRDIADAGFCRICYFDLFPHIPSSVKQVNAEVRAVARQMERWAQSLYESGVYKVFHMGDIL